MGAGITSYLDFAENDYNFFKASYNSGNKGGALAAIGQNICERYFKHIISEYAQPENARETMDKENVLRTHNLQRLMKYMRDEMGIQISDEAEAAIERINGFYFSTRYPGADSFIPSERDIDKANTAVEYARSITLELCKIFEDPEAEQKPEQEPEAEQES